MIDNTIQYNGINLRTAWDEDGLWLSMCDLADLLRYKNPRQMVDKLRGEAEERFFHSKNTLGVDVTMVYLNKESAKALINKSQLGYKEDLLIWLENEAQARKYGRPSHSKRASKIGKTEGIKDPDQYDLEEYLQNCCGEKAKKGTQNSATHTHDEEPVALKEEYPASNTSEPIGPVTIILQTEMGEKGQDEDEDVFTVPLKLIWITPQTGENGCISPGQPLQALGMEKDPDGYSRLICGLCPDPYMRTAIATTDEDFYQIVDVKVIADIEKIGEVLAGKTHILPYGEIDEYPEAEESVDVSVNEHDYTINVAWAGYWLTVSKDNETINGDDK